MPYYLLDVLLLKDEALCRIAFSKQYFAMSWICLSLGAFFAAFGYFLFPLTEGDLSYRPDFFWIAAHFLVNFFVQLGFIAGTFFLGKRLFGMELGKVPYFQLMAHAHVVLLFAIYPPLSPVFFAWLFLIEGMIFRRFARFGWPLVACLILVQGLLWWVFMRHTL